ncbi:hypothetical protein [Duganella aquatilis]|uniref:hypothetical protein n=1 Tax=Duganella aquatilis TaxID=2666082 RepID=UPI00140E4507|nr:hypothetical protein [Duganella aquatilis]
MSVFWILLLLAVGAQAAPPVLDIDSLPVTAACRPGKALAGQTDGPMLLRPTSSAVAPPAVPPAVPTATAGDLYQSTSDIGDWSGHFSRYVLAAGAAGAGTVSTLAWDAGAILTGSAARAPAPLPEQRNIYTAIIQPTGAGDVAIRVVRPVRRAASAAQP